MPREPTSGGAESIFVYEHMCGGLSDDLAERAADSLFREGGAMLAALANDFAAAGLTTNVMLSRSVELDRFQGVTTHLVESPEQALGLFDQLASECDWTVVIAPESAGTLRAMAGRVMELGGRLLGPSLEVIELAGDKHRTAEHLLAHDVPAPRGRQIEAGRALPLDLNFPLVVKPRDGAGSEGVRVVNAPEEIAANLALTREMRIEELRQGTHVSVAVLTGSGGNLPLVPCLQRLSDDGRFSYFGGRLPLSDALASRAVNLALRAVATLPPCFGYLGVDLVLGERESEDAVIEINPRLTTSYVGLRRACRGNLAAAMLAVARGERATFDFRPGAVDFDANGAVRLIPSEVDAR